jgi:agmatine deiminase
MPGEFAPHERTVICWPSRHDLYGNHIGDARLAHAALAKTISGFEPVTMIANAQDAERARLLCGDAVEVVELPLDDSWFRDTGPIYVFDGEKRIAGNWVFNGWGNKFKPHDADAALAQRVTSVFGDDVSSINIVLEGGSVNVDGAGTLITTMQCLLHPNRNPNMSQKEIQEVLCEELGVLSVVWLPHGLALDFDTDGHVDNVAAFTRPGHVLLQGCSDSSEEDFVRLAINEKVARSSTAANGEQLQVDVIPVLPFVEYNGERIVVPYLNFYVGNGFVIVPVCGHAADHDMVQMISEFFPGRSTVPLDIGRILAIGGGGIHCITQQRPATA